MIANRFITNLFFFVTLCIAIIAEYTPQRSINIPSNTKHLLYTHNQKYIVAASSATISLFWGVNATFIKNISTDASSEITSITTNQFDQIAVGYSDGALNILSLQGDRITIANVEGAEESAVTSMCFSGQNRHIVYGTQDGYVYVLDYQKQEELGMVNFADSSPVRTVSCYPNNSQNLDLFVAGGAINGSSKFILYQFSKDAQTNITQVYSFPQHEGQILASTIQKDSKLISSVGQNGKIYIYDSITFQESIQELQTNDTLYGIYIYYGADVILTINSTGVLVCLPSGSENSVICSVYPTNGMILGASPFAQNFIVKSDNKGQIFGLCQQGQFFNTNRMQCEKCLSQCSLCFGSNDTCYQCSKTYYLQNTSCLTCGQGCLHCLKADDCIQCDTFAHFLKNQTTGKCQCYPTYYDDNGQCKQCADAIVACILCTDRNTCTECDAGQHRILHNHGCVCQSEYYEDGGVCVECREAIKHCVTCTSKDACIKCNEQQHWVVNSTKGNCICDQGYEQIEDTCIKCPIGCLECDSQQQCLKCDAKHNFNETPINGSCFCKEKYFYDQQKQVCNPCMVGCLKCTVFQSCLICDSKSYFIRDEDTGKCVCQKYYYEYRDKCLSCSDTLQYCQQCTSNTKCDKCQGQLELINGKCGCSSGKYITPDKKCANCQLGCSQCRNSSYCITCDYNKHFVRNLTNYKCQCEIMYYFSDRQTCKLCSEAIEFCIECQNSNYCDRCDIDQHKYAQNGKCLCIDGYYQDEDKKCQKCQIENCKTCENAQSCTNCEDQYYLEEGICKMNQEGVNVWVIIGPSVGGCLCCSLIVVFILVRRKKIRDRESLLESVEGSADDSLVVNPPQ